ncbi:endonuclease/exonuclease/phosphatase family protein [Halosimplex aquaticum]|uniref:Endonuclease/exonuclease/phosphatase family protein n=1 Tax=Halosimplex aquaticum TaxID=3026162 RepID=A0ABD5Y5G5_9EURY|nr:endonuclease/exonuclease/phosphatase family protein [Halosimplex aquaticum]
MPSASPDSDDPSCSRRAVLAGVAGLPAGIAGRRSGRLRSTDRPPATRPVTVATWNVALGVDLFKLFDARSADDVREIAGELLAGARKHPYEARAAAIADALVAADADAVALQEAARIRAGSTETDGDGETVADLLDSVRSALEARDRPYEVAASTVTTDVELPVESESGRETVRLTDRDVLLVRPGVDARNARGETYDERMEFPVPGTDRTVALRRGYCRADVGPEGAAFTAVSTHLESVSASTRRRQAMELLDALPADGPVVVGGDFNSGPGTITSAYDALTDSLTDAHAQLRPDDDGYTCCRASIVGEGGSRLTKRIDGLLARGEARPTAVERLGEESADRGETTVDGETVAVWPSDHAGVVGTFEVPASAPTQTETRRSTRTRGAETTTGTGTGTPVPTGPGDEPSAASGSSAATDDPSGTTNGSGAGFGALAGAAAFVFAALARGRK